MGYHRSENINYSFNVTLYYNIIVWLHNTYGNLMSDILYTCKLNN